MISSGISWLCSILSFSASEMLEKTSTRLIFAAGTSMLAVLLLGPMFIRKLIALKVGQPIRDDEGFLLGELHKKKKDTPTMGGALIIVAVLISSVLWADWSSIFVPLLLVPYVLFGVIGAFDDWAKLKNKSVSHWSKGLSGKLRIILQTLIALLVIVLLSCPEILQLLGFSLPQLIANGASVEWPTWQGAINLPFVAKPIFIAAGASWLIIWGLQWLTMVGAANAVNLTDGLDGLAAGCSFLVSVAMGFAALLSNHQDLASAHSMIFIQSSGEIAVLLAALAGGCLGFLWFNSFPAQVFMGDTGSLAIGGMLGTAAVLLKREWFLALVGAIFVVETVSVMVQVVSFKHSGKRVFLCTPLHHHFEYAGLHEAKVVVRFWIVGLILVCIGFLSLQTQ
jgi:phospho-N-acetylmuramoyl-pentapeptide-transferase